MKIDSIVSVAITKAQQCLLQHDAYMAQSMHRMDRQTSDANDLIFTVGSHELQKQHSVLQGNPPAPITDTALSAITSTLLNMRDILVQAIAEANDTQKQSIPLNEEDSQHTKKLTFDHVHSTLLAGHSKSEETSSYHGTNAVNSKNSAVDPVSMAYAAVSNINAALQQISKSRMTLHSMHEQTDILSALPSSSISDAGAAKERSEQTKVQILDEAANSMHSQAHQNPIALYSLFQ